MLTDLRFISNADRVRNRPALREIVAAIALDHEIGELSAIFDRVGIPFSPVNKPSDLFTDPQALAHALQVRLPTGDLAALPPLPIAIDNAAPGLRTQPPAAGEHTSQILAELGYGPDKISALRDSGAVE